MVQPGHERNGPLKSTADLSEDLDQQARVIPGQSQAREGDVSMRVQGGDEEGQDGVHDSQGDGENSQKALADVGPLEKHQNPVEEAFSSQTEQDTSDGDDHGAAVFKGQWVSGSLGKLCCCCWGRSV